MWSTIDMLYAVSAIASVNLVLVFAGIVSVKISRHIQARRIRNAGGNIYVASRIKE